MDGTVWCDSVGGGFPPFMLGRAPGDWESYSRRF